MNISILTWDKLQNNLNFRDIKIELSNNRFTLFNLKKDANKCKNRFAQSFFKIYVMGQVNILKKLSIF